VKASDAAAASRANVALLPLVTVAGLVATFLTANVLSVGDFAVYAVAIAIRLTIQYLADLGLGAASTLAFSRLHHAGGRAAALRLYRRFLGARLLLVAAVAAVVVVAPVGLADALGVVDDRTEFLLFCVAIALLEISGTLGYYALIAVYAHRAANAAQLAASVLQPVLVIAAAASGAGLEGILLAIVLAAAVRSLGWNLAAVRRLRAIAERTPDTSGLARRLAGATAASVSGKAAAWLHSRSFVTLAAAGSRPPQEIGAFALAHDVAAQVLSAATIPLTGLLLPTFARAADDPARTEAVYRRALRLAALLVLPPTALLAACGPALVDVLLGDRFPGVLALGAVLLPALALETVLALPANNLALAHEALTRQYVVLRLAVAALAVAYLALVGHPIIVAVAYMASVRLLATLALHALIARRTGLRIEGAWFGRWLALNAAAGAAGATTAAAFDAPAAGIAAALACTVLVLGAGVRPVGALRRADVDFVVGVTPQLAVVARAARPFVTTAHGEGRG